MTKLREAAEAVLLTPAGNDSAEFLKWVADRLVFVYKERRGVDFVIAVRDISAGLTILRSALASDDVGEGERERIAGAVRHAGQSVYPRVAAEALATRIRAGEFARGESHDSDQPLSAGARGAELRYASSTPQATADAVIEYIDRKAHAQLCQCGNGVGYIDAACTDLRRTLATRLKGGGR